MTKSLAVAAAFLSTGLISLAPNVLLFLFPNYSASTSQSSANKAMLSLGQALAVGGLMGDVFLHTLPDCFGQEGDRHGNSHSHGHKNHDHESHHEGEDVGVRVLAGFAVFLLLDIIVRSLDPDGHSHNHSNATTNGTCDGSKATAHHTTKSQWRLIFSSAVLLNLIGDALHNFTDGLAIGATFAASHIPSTAFEASSPMSWLSSSFALLKSRGGLASMSVFLHEIPHELGDFATLVNAGMSRNMAIGLQFVTAVAAFLGTALGLFSSQIIEGLGHDVLLPFTAGGFIYLACTTILPEILETRVSAFVRILQICSFATGLAFMYAVGVLEEMEAHDKHSHHHHHHDHGEL
jgi:zinc transporter 7